MAPYLPGSRTGPGHRAPSRSARGRGPHAQSQCPAAPPARTGKKSGSRAPSAVPQARPRGTPQGPPPRTSHMGWHTPYNLLRQRLPIETRSEPPRCGRGGCLGAQASQGPDPAAGNPPRGAPRRESPALGAPRTGPPPPPAQGMQGHGAPAPHRRLQEGCSRLRPWGERGHPVSPPLSHLPLGWPTALPALGLEAA